MRVQRRGPWHREVFLAFMLGAAALAAEPGVTSTLFDDLYRRGQLQNGDLRTLTATFVETTTSALLTKPLTARGIVTVERPSRVALRYTEPDERVVLIDGDRLTVTWPARGIRKTRDVGAAQRRVQKYFVDSSPEELRSHFDIDARENAGHQGYLITLVPRRKQIKEGLDRLELWIDPVSLLMTSMKMTFPNGDTKLMVFTDVKPNASIDPAVFRHEVSR